MVSTKKLIRMARKWLKIASAGRKRLSFPQTKGSRDEGRYNSPSVADKGHFVVYSTDQIRFVIPLGYLQNAIFRDLFTISEEEFGLPRDGPIMFPCDAVFMECVLSFMGRGLAQEEEKALLFSINTNRCSLPLVHQQETGQQVVVCR